MGCRSGRVGSGGLFGFGGQPSAEALAGSGPTTTYPRPPSESATPEAIASIAGGTIAPSTVTPSTFGQNSFAQNSATQNPTAAGSTTRSSVQPTTPSYAGINPGAVTPAAATAPNMSASQANGFNTKPAGFSVPEIKTPTVTTPNVSMPSGYQFGNSSTPPTNQITSNQMASAESNYALPKAIPPPANTNAPKSNSFVVPDMPVVKTRLGDNPGMSLPGELAENIMASVPAAKSVFTPKPTTQNASINVTLPSVQMGGSTGTPQINLPEVSIAASPAPPTVTNSAAATTNPWSGGTSGGYSPGTSGGYSPGSTSGGSGYPSGSYAAPDSSGSLYR